MITKTHHPDHYVGDVEPIDLIVSLGIGKPFCQGAVLKYVARYAKKGEPMKDLLKAKQFLEWLIELQEEESDASQNPR